MVSETITLLLVINVFLVGVNCIDFTRNRNGSALDDLTDKCVNGDEFDYFMPFGKGRNDGLLVFLTKTNKETTNCTIVFNVRPGPKAFQTLAVEFLPSRRLSEELLKPCKERKGGFITITDKNITHNACDFFKTSMFGYPYLTYFTNSDRISIHFEAKGNVRNLKLTATSGRTLGFGEICKIDTEFECTVGGQPICINRGLVCNGDINCGAYEDLDEDYRYCRTDEFSNYWLISLAGLLVVTLVYCIFFYCVKLHVTKTTGNYFIFNEDKENKLVIRSQLNSYEWREYKKETISDVSPVIGSEKAKV